MLVRPSKPRRASRFARPLGLSRDNAWLALSTLLYGASLGFYQYVIPLYTAQLGASPDQVGLGLAIGNSGGVVGLIAGGVIVNRFGYRPQIIWSTAVAVVAGVAFLVAASWQVIALGLFLAALTLFGIPAYNAYIVLASDGQNTAEALTIVYVGFTAGTAFTPALGGLIIASSGMRPMFLASLVCIVAATIATVPIRERARPTDLATGTTSRPTSWRWLRPLVAYREALTDPAMRGLFVVLVALYLARFVGLSLLPNYLQDRLGLDPSTVSALGTGTAFVGVVASLGLTRLMRRIGAYRALAISEALLILGLGLSLAAPALGSWATLAGGAGFALRGGAQAQDSLARAMIATTAARASLGPAFALQSIIFNVAVTVGPALAGPAYTVDPGLPLVIAVAVGLPLTIWLVARHPPAKGA